MQIKKSLISGLLHSTKLIFSVVVFCTFFSFSAKADLLDAFNLSPFVPTVLEIMANIASDLYKFFVGNGTGLIYIFVYLFVAFYICMYLIKMHFPKDWLGFFGFSEGGEMWDGKTDGWKIADNVLKPCIRGVVAAVILLQIKPIYVTEWLVNPFLEFGAIYTEHIFENITNSNPDLSNMPKCPESIVAQGWISERSCDFLVQPVHIISQENNRVIKYGFGFLKSGLRGLLTIIPHGAEPFLNILTGVLLISSFVASNVFMALLIIQAIFDFCLALIMYPFNVLGWVAKKSDKWVDVLPVFSQIIDSLKKLVITMIACAFILCINIALVKSLFNWSSSIFVAAAGGTAATNVPTISSSVLNFGQHSMLWLSSLLTYFLMYAIFKMTRQKLDQYTSGTKPKLYNDVKSDASTYWGKIKSARETMKNIWNGKQKITQKK